MFNDMGTLGVFFNRFLKVFKFYTHIRINSNYTSRFNLPYIKFCLDVSVSVRVSGNVSVCT